jgi:uncharacterized protein (DUF2237 family)
MDSGVKNVLGGPLQSCCIDPMTGFYRDGACNTGPDDHGVHIICVQVTQAFLDFSSQCGNDLQTPYPQYKFPGLKPGDRWCLCISRWVEAHQEGVAPPVILESTHEKALEYVSYEVLKLYDITTLN